MIVEFNYFQLSVRWSRSIAATDAYDTAIEDALQNILFASRSNSSGILLYTQLYVYAALSVFVLLFCDSGC